MGRKKISIATIQDDRLRNITFNKRKSGLLKKAAELSMLCNIQVCLAFTDVYGNLINFYSPDASVAQEFSKTHPYKKVYTFTRDDYPNFFGMRNKKKQSDIKKEDGEESQMDQIDESENGEDDDEEMSHNSKISEINSVSKKSNHRNNELNSTNNLAVKAKPQPKKQLKISVPENKIVIQSMNVLKSTFMEGGQAAPNQATNVTSDSNKNQLLINQQQQYHIVPSQNQAGLTNMQSNIMGGNQNFQSSMIHQTQKGSSGNNIENPQNSNMGNILNQQLLAQNTIQGMKMQEDMKQQLQQFAVSGGGINQQSIMNQNLIKNMQSELNSVSQNPFDILNSLQQTDPSSAVMGNTQNFLNNQLYSNSNNFMNLAQQVSPQFANNSLLQNQQQSFDMYNAQQQNQQQQNANQNQQQSINAQQQQQQSNQVNQSQQQQQQQQQNQQAAQQQQLKKSFRPSSKSGLNSNNGLLFQSSNNQGFLEQLLLHQYQQPSISNQALQQRITSNSHNFLVPKSGNFQNPTSNPSIFNFINGKINESPHIDKIKTSLPTYNTSNPFLNASLFSGNNFNKTYLELNSLTPALNQDESLNIMSQQYQPFSMQNQLSQSFQKQVGNQLEQEMQQNQNGQQNYQGSSINSVLLQNQNQHQVLHNQQPQSQNQILINPNQTNMNNNNNNKSNNMNVQNNNNNNSLLQPGMNNQQNQQQILNSHFYQQQQPMQNLLTKHEEAMNNTLLNGANTKYIVHEGGENKTQNINLSHPAHNNILQANQNDSKMQ